MVQGLENGDFSLLYVAAPVDGHTLLAAAAAASSSVAVRYGGVLLTSLTAALAVLLLSAYGLGLFHLPQALLATVLSAVAASRTG